MSYYPNGNMKSKEVKGDSYNYSSWYENGNPRESTFTYTDSTVSIFQNESGMKIAERITIPGWIKTRGWNDNGELIYEAKKGRSERDYYRPGILLIRKREVKKIVKLHPELKYWMVGY